jgi:hypothetical protein
MPFTEPLHGSERLLFFEQLLDESGSAWRRYFSHDG